MNTNLLSRITTNIEQCGGKPCIRNMRIRVSDILDLLANGISPEQIIAEELPDLEIEDVYACFAFASSKIKPSNFTSCMILILDAHISPSLAVWIKEKFSINCYSATFLGLREANDKTIFVEAKQQNAIVITKDDDFVKLLEQLGSPPKVIWLTCGNSSKQRLKEVFEQHLLDALKLLENTDLVEITGF